MAASSEAAAARLICPKCRVEMEAEDADGFQSDTCPRCGGVWVDNVEEKRVLEMAPEVFTVDELRMLRKAYQPWDKVEEVKYFQCPRCANLMWRINYLHHSGIIVDKCREHGAFFDKGELEKARDFIRKGGVEYEKLRLTERGDAELRIRITKVADKVERMSYKLPWYARLMLYFGY